LNILAIDTTGGACSAAVAIDGNLICEQYLDHGLTHSAMLMPIIDSCFSMAGMRPHEMDVFGVAVGPGSFTGLRIGVATVKAFAQFTGRRVAAISTLDALHANGAGFDGLVCPIIDARRGQVYTALYNRGEKLLADTPMDLEELLARLEGRRTLFLGDGVRVYRERICRTLAEAVFAPPHLLLQRAGGVALLTLQAHQRGALYTAEELMPRYLRETQAERLKRGK